MEENDQSVFVEVFGDNPVIKILDVMISGRGFDYSKADLVRCANISMATVNRELPKLIEKGIIKYTRKIGKAKLYVLNYDSSIAHDIVKLRNTIINDIINREFGSEVKPIELEPVEQKVAVAH
ncbi:MAG: hypothetical protein ABIH55_01565 [Nanoarchaeota archaeon]|nr:hypothetical protein [Nanoarchaeota archaeon]MBU1135576.1 hypothetical protein [Nanoarchaeota archaeon]